MKKILILPFLFIIQQSLNSFPGDHNSLTCDQNFLDLNLQAVIYGTEDEYNVDTTTPLPATRMQPRAITEADLVAYYRVAALTDLWKKQNRNNIIAAINADIKKPATSLIFKKIKDGHDNTFEGKPLQVTKWGDSLSDFVSFYGVLTPGALGDGTPAPPVGGTYGGSPLWIDSWSDYFSIWGQPPLAPVYVRNYGIATYQSPSVMDLMGFSSYEDTVNGWWDITPTTNKCPKGGPEGVEVKVSDWFIANAQPAHYQNGKSALHSSLMVGGNDSMQGMLHRALLPTFSTYTMDLVIENITFMTDWHLENGKKVLLEGAIPGYSGPIDQYDSLIVNRKALCRPLADSFIKPQDIPWWACALGPNVCYAMAKAAKEYDEKVAKSFNDFWKKVNRKKTNDQTNFSNSLNSMNLNNFAENLGNMGTSTGNIIEDHSAAIVGFFVGNLLGGPIAGAATASEIEKELSKDRRLKEEWRNVPFMRLLSINQACINDRIEYDVGPAYKAAYPGYVETFALYNYFSNEWDFNFGNNFWVPKNGIYDKYSDVLSILKVSEGSVGDPIHIGPKGYELWGTLIGTKLKSLGWNRTDDYIDPIVNVDNDGPGKIIKKKSKEVGIFGQESTATIRIPSYCEDKVNGYGKYGGYQRRYKDGSVIYLRQLFDVPASDSVTKFDIPHVVSGLHQVRYDQEGGPTGRLGFPTTDKYCEGIACSVESVLFECGKIFDNHLDFIQHFHTEMTSGCITGKIVSCP